MSGLIARLYDMVNPYPYDVPPEKEGCPNDLDGQFDGDYIDIDRCPTKIDVAQALEETSQGGEITADSIKSFTGDINYLLGKNPQALLILAQRLRRGNYQQMGFGAAGVTMCGTITMGLGVLVPPTLLLTVPLAAAGAYGNKDGLISLYHTKQLMDAIIEKAEAAVSGPQSMEEITADEILSLLPPIETISEQLQIELQAIAKLVSVEVSKKFDCSSIV